MKRAGCALVVLTLVSLSISFPGASAGQGRGVWIENTPCSEDEILDPTDYRERDGGRGADGWYVCRQAEDYAISLIRRVEASHDSVTCYIVAQKPRHWYRHHGLKVVATEMCHH